MLLHPCARSFSALAVVVSVAAVTAVPSDARQVRGRYESQWHERVVTAFKGSNGAYPQAELVGGENGELYGTTAAGGPDYDGTVFDLTPSPAGYRLRILHDFSGPPHDGASPHRLLYVNGKLYGTTSSGGNGPCLNDSGQKAGCGTIFELAPSAPGMTERVLYNFQGAPNDGQAPNALVADERGSFFGTAASGGPGDCGCGTIFVLYPSGRRFAERTIYAFAGEPSDGDYPTSILLYRHALYGTTFQGGPNWCELSSSGGGCGTAFKLMGSGSHYTETILYNFRGFWTQNPDGGFPVTLILSPNGTFYGSTQQGGSQNNGAVFHLTPSTSGYTESVLYNFLGTGDGAYPNGGLIEDAAGNLFGTTSFGGSATCSGGCGTAFRLTTKPGYAESILYDFNRAAFGWNPEAGLFAGRDGKLFGVTYNGGIPNYGVVYSLQP